MKISRLILPASLLLLGACQIYPPTPNPDYTIRVTTDADGKLAAIRPDCANWVRDTTDPFDDQPTPQLGCANARNLAAMVENPGDLVEPAAMSPTRGVTQVGAMRRYDNNQTRGLIWTGTDPNQVAVTSSSTAASPMTGDSPGTGGGGSTSTSPSPSGAAP